MATAHAVAHYQAQAAMATQWHKTHSPDTIKACHDGAKDELDRSGYDLAVSLGRLTLDAVREPVVIPLASTPVDVTTLHPQTLLVLVLHPSTPQAHRDAARVALLELVRQEPDFVRAIDDRTDELLAECEPEDADEVCA